MSVVSELIVLGHTKYTDNSIVLHTLSREWGRRGFLVRVGKKASMALFLPMNLLEASVTPNTKSSLWWAGKIHSLSPLSGIRCDMGKNSMTLFLSEVLYRTIREDGSDERLFDWCKSQILALDGMEGSCANFHLRFLMEYTGMLGFMPSFGNLAPFLRENAPKAKEILEGSLEEALRVEMDGASRGALAQDIISYLEFHTESKINIKSLSVLRELFR